MARIDPKFMLWLPEELRDRIKDQAAANNRSMNAEIIARLERSFDEADRINREDLQEFLRSAVDQAVYQIMTTKPD